MQVSKTINNNIVSCLDESGREYIVMGRGLGFQYKPGSTVPPDQIEKVFHLENPQEADRFKTLVSNLPPQYLRLCTQIIDYAAETLAVQLQESVYLTLTDHISFAIERQKRGIDFHNPLEYEVRTFYPQEYAAGRHALTMIRDNLNIVLPEDEAASIALHLINAECNGSLQDTLHTTQLLHDILNRLAQDPRLKLQYGDPYYDELAVLLKFLVQRVTTNGTVTDPDPELLYYIRLHCAEAFEIAQDALRQLEIACGHTIPQEEAAYLALHLRRILISHSTKQIETQRH